MVRTTLLLDDDLALEVKRLAREQGKTKTQIVREALDAYIAQQRRPELPSFAGVGKSGRRSVSEKAEEILKRQANRREGRWCAFLYLGPTRLSPVWTPWPAMADPAFPVLSTAGGDLPLKKSGELVPAGEAAHALVTLKSSHDGVELVAGNMLEQLFENGSILGHRKPPWLFGSRFVFFKFKSRAF